MTAARTQNRISVNLLTSIEQLIGLERTKHGKKFHDSGLDVPFWH